MLDGHPLLHAAYYVIAVLCGVVILVRPDAARRIALTESGANIAILVIGVFVAYFAVLDSAGGPGPLVNPFTPEAVANLAISAGWGYAALVRAGADLRPIAS